MALLEGAVSKNRSPENLISLAQHLAFLGEGKSGPKQDLERALRLTKEAAAANTRDDPSYWAVAAQLAVELAKEEDLRDATKALVKQYPEAMATHYFSAVVAAEDEDWIKAEDEIKRHNAWGFLPK